MFSIDEFSIISVLQDFVCKCFTAETALKEHVHVIRCSCRAAESMLLLHEELGSLSQGVFRFQAAVHAWASSSLLKQVVVGAIAESLRAHEDPVHD